jgi:hypothetical protein
MKPRNPADVAPPRSVETHRRLEGLLPARFSGAAHRFGTIIHRLPCASGEVHAAGRVRRQRGRRAHRRRGLRTLPRRASELPCPQSHVRYHHEAKSVQQAREYYAKEFADYRRKKPTPYMERLHFQPDDRNAADPDVQVLSDEVLAAAVNEGKSQG